MQAIILATHSDYKTREFQALMPGHQIIRMSEIGFRDDIPETGQTFRENALIKAKAVKAYLSQRRDPGYIVVAEDSGLCVDALDGRPGVYTARYGGARCSDHEQRMILLDELDGVIDRSAHFECFIACYAPGRDLFTAVGVTAGRIADSERGQNGFAFDQIFESTDLGKTFGEATAEEKDRVSHRARAITQLSAYLEELQLG